MSISTCALREEGDRAHCCTCLLLRYFYPRPPRGGRRTPCPRLRHSPNFYPRPPRGGRHELRLISGCRFLFLSTPSARRATHRCAGGLNVQADFYPRPPRGGRRFVEFFIGKLAEFLSTPSARRATKAQDLKRAIELISIHALREEGDGCAFSGHRSDTISIHALREEGDTAATWHRRPPSNFYPRPPRGGRPGSRPS